MMGQAALRDLFDCSFLYFSYFVGMVPIDMDSDEKVVEKQASLSVDHI